MADVKQYIRKRRFACPSNQQSPRVWRQFACDDSSRSLNVGSFCLFLLLLALLVLILILVAALLVAVA
jgi:hypothetical protein